MPRSTDYIAAMPSPETLKQMHFRAHHRGTREADFMIGGFFDANHAHWGEQECAWFEALLQEQDVDIMAWAMRKAEPPARFEGPMLETLRRLDFVKVHK